MEKSGFVSGHTFLQMGVAYNSHFAMKDEEGGNNGKECGCFVTNKEYCTCQTVEVC